MEWLILYIVGVVIAYVLCIKEELKNNDLTIGDIVLLFVPSLLSWTLVLAYGVSYILGREFWDKVIIHKRK